MGIVKSAMYVPLSRTICVPGTLQARATASATPGQPWAAVQRISGSGITGVSLCVGAAGPRGFAFGDEVAGGSYGFGAVLAETGLLGEEDGISALDADGRIERHDFGARGAGAVHHRVQDLGGDDGRLGEKVADLVDFAFRDGDVRHSDFDSEVAARDHQRV